MEKRPIIGISPAMEDESRSFVLSSYLRAVEDAGGVPILLPELKSSEAALAAASLCDGFLVTGGYDISPEIYGEAPSPQLGRLCPERDAAELLLLPVMLGTGKPLLAICRGAQLLNAHLGGTLLQDIPTEYKTDISHRQTAAGDILTHAVTVLPTSPLYGILGKEKFSVNSLHHQAIKRLAPDLMAMAWAEDGIIEAAYCPSHRFLWAIQWHPEKSYFSDTVSQRLFAAFIDAAKNA